MNDKDYLGACAKVASLWPHSPVTAETIKFGRPLLADLDEAMVSAAIDQFATDGERFAPTMGMIRNWVMNAGFRPPSPDDAWAEVRSQIALAMSDRDLVPWSNSVVRDVARGLGWKDLCWSDNLMADRAHFLKCYTERVAQQRKVNATPQSVSDLQTSMLESGMLELEAPSDGLDWLSGDGVTYR